MRKLLLVLVMLLSVGVVLAQDAPTPSNALSLTPLGTYATGIFDDGAAEITAYHAGTQRLFITNGSAGALDIVDISDPAAPALVRQVSIEDYGDGLQSVAVYGDTVAVAVAADPSTDPGAVVFFTPDGDFISQVTVGALPDMLTFTPDGTRVLTANEGEPNDDYSVDPEGSVSIIDVSGGFDAPTVTTVGFADFNAGGARAADLPADVRIYGPNASVAQDLEPEYIALATVDGVLLAYVTLQENNALAVIDVAAGTVLRIVALGYKDHNLPGNGLDATKDDGAVTIANYPVFGMYQPDGIAAFAAGGATYLITANEGDTRDYDTFSEEAELLDLTLDATVFPNAADLQSDALIGELELTNVQGDTDGDGDYDALYLPGARSFSIWSADGTLVFDSGAALELMTAAAYPNNFNASNDDNALDDRSDNKGPEPESVIVADIGGKLYAFVALERIGGIVVYDVSDPLNPVFVTYANNRDFGFDPDSGMAKDLGPEGLLFIPADASPTGAPLLIVTNEVSGTTTVYSIGGM